MTEIINPESVDIEIVSEEKYILLPCICRPMMLHFGNQSDYGRFLYSYFIKTDPEPDEIFIYKHIINSVRYVPDDTYSLVDGMVGRCWIVTINNVENDTFDNFYIRNWIDIVEYFKEKGLKFVVENNNI